MQAAKSYFFFASAANSNKNKAINQTWRTSGHRLQAKSPVAHLLYQRYNHTRYYTHCEGKKNKILRTTYNFKDLHIRPFK